MLNKKLIPYWRILIYYCIFCVLIFAFQRKILYFPQSMPFPVKGWSVVKNNEEALGLSRREGQENIVVVFHGNAGNASIRNYYLDIIPNNYTLIVAEYPGFGINEGEAINQDNIVRKARALMREIKPKGQLIILGESLGSAIAAQMAQEFKADKLILVTPYDKLQKVAQSRFWFLPAYYLLRDKWDTQESIKNYSGETLLIIAQKDSVIAPRFAQSLFEAMSSPKDRIIVQGADHNDWLDMLNPEQRIKILKFIKNG